MFYNHIIYSLFVLIPPLNITRDCFVSSFFWMSNHSKAVPSAHLHVRPQQYKLMLDVELSFVYYYISDLFWHFGDKHFSLLFTIKQEQPYKSSFTKSMTYLIGHIDFILIVLLENIKYKIKKVNTFQSICFYTIQFPGRCWKILDYFSFNCRYNF